MSITLQKMVAQTAEITFPWGEDTVTFSYHPGKVTETFLSQVLAISRMDEATFEATFKSFNTNLADVLQSWDVLDGDGSDGAMFPLDASRFSELPLIFRMQVAIQVMQDMRPNS